MGNDSADGRRRDPASRPFIGCTQVIERPRALNPVSWLVDKNHMNNPLAYSAAAKKTAVGAERRLRGRVRQQGVISTLGTVLDLSATGMRVLGTAPPPPQAIKVQIASDRDSIVLLAELVWTKKVGFRRHVSGLRFLDLDENQTQRLSQLAAANRIVAT